MSKGDSGLFKGTNSTTAYVWSDITATQPTYEGTAIPKSFIMKTANGDFWVHGNATEHMADYVLKKMKSGTSLESVRLNSQIILADMHESLSAVTKSGFRYNELLAHGNWEFVIRKPKSADKYDAVIHAMYRK